ncbi:MAG: hypothetical protein K2X90_01110 [Candidatus Babeliaceae bacterium]|nr:hypothetical protein [Candidatus Babeliaceae bacterium]
MNYKMLFLGLNFFAVFVHARYYQSIFSEWGRELDEMYNSFNSLNTRMHVHESPSFTLEKSESAVSVTIDTGKKVSSDDISITHKNNKVTVDIKGLEHMLSLHLESSKHALAISLCSRMHEEKKHDQAYSAYQGSSCMQQMISVGVDLSGISAEYSGTKLLLSVPLVKEEQGKKIPVVMKPEEHNGSKAEVEKEKKIRQKPQIINEK